MANDNNRIIYELRMIERELKDVGKYSKANRFVIQFDESIEFPEWEVSKFEYGNDNTFTISLMDYVFKCDGIKYSTESYFNEKMKGQSNYNIEIIHLEPDNGETMYIESFTDCKIIQIKPDNLDYGSDEIHKIKVTFSYEKKEYDF